MTQSDDTLNQKVEKLGEFSLSLLRSFTILRWIGYGLIILFMFDFIEILIPPNFLNPSWGFQAMGQVVERLVVPLLGLVFIFYGENNLRQSLEIPFLKFISWLTLLSSILLFLLIPLGVVNPIRINSQANTQIEQAKTRVNEVKNEFADANTPEKMSALLKKIAPNDNINIENEQQLEILRGRLSQVIQTQENEIQQVEATRSQQRLSLLKSAVKWNLGALVSGVLFLIIWKNTNWARKL